jgi:hypothetical protein
MVRPVILTAMSSRSTRSIVPEGPHPYDVTRHEDTTHNECEQDSQADSCYYRTPSLYDPDRNGTSG